MNATACSQTGCSGLAPASEPFPFGAPAAATSPCRAFMNKPYPFPSSYMIPFLLNLTHTTRTQKGPGVGQARKVDVILVTELTHWGC